LHPIILGDNYAISFESLEWHSVDNEQDSVFFCICQRFKKLRMRVIIVRMISKGEVAKMKPLLLYTQMIIQGSFSRPGTCRAMKGRATIIIPTIITAMPISAKG
jgi:hypothetical protein